jgi:ArsR family transcriptional regulator
MAQNRKNLAPGECCPSEELSPDLRPIEGKEADEEVALLAKAVGHPARVRVLRMLAVRKSCICGDIVEQIDLAQSTVSQHLKVLKEAGLIRGDIEGASTCYCLNQRGLKRLKVLIAGL